MPSPSKHACDNDDGRTNLWMIPKHFYTLAYVKELVNYDWPNSLWVHRPPVSIHDIRVFWRRMLWQDSQLWLRKLRCYLPQQSPLECTMNAKMIPALWFLLSCNMPSPQEYIVSCLPQPASTKRYSSHTLFHTHWCCSEQRTACTH